MRHVQVRWLTVSSLATKESTPMANLYLFTSILLIGAGIIITASVVVAIVHMIRNRNSEHVQDLEAPIRTYLDNE